MGTSVLLVFIAPFLAIYALFVGIFSEFAPKPQAEIILPYNESQGLVWEYEEQEDYYIDLVEEKIDGNKQIFVFEADLSMSSDLLELFSVATNPTYGRIIDFVFTDQNGNERTYYHDRRKEATDQLVIYEARDCFVTEYTVSAQDPQNAEYWSIDSYNDEDNILRQPWGKDEVTFTVIFMPDEVEKMKNGETEIIWFTNDYWVNRVEYKEAYRLTFGADENGRIVILEEYHELEKV